MKKQMFILVCIFLSVAMVSCKKEKAIQEEPEKTTLSSEIATDGDSTVKKGFKSVVSGTVSASKDTLSGISEGVYEGRKSGDSIDGAQIISSKNEFLEKLQLSSLKVEDLGGQTYKIFVAVKNSNDEIFRLTGLTDLKSLVLLDKDGFVYTLPATLNQRKDVTILNNSTTRLTYTFNNVEGVPAVFRLYGGIDVDLLKVSKTE